MPMRYWENYCTIVIWGALQCYNDTIPYCVLDEWVASYLLRVLTVNTQYLIIQSATQMRILRTVRVLLFFTYKQQHNIYPYTW